MTVADVFHEPIAGFLGNVKRSLISDWPPTDLALAGFKRAR